MPPTNEPAKQKSLQEVVDELDRYPVEAFHFVQQGLSYTVGKVHGEATDDPTVSRHISGQQLCEGLRDFALLKWGMLARTVLRRWNINATFDFGRIVFAMVQSGLMHKTDEDGVEDFRDVYDFKGAFENGYRIPLETLERIEKSNEARP
jgi:uncharacterized repeat protein (TIGR04138 family)